MKNIQRISAIYIIVGHETPEWGVLLMLIALKRLTPPQDWQIVCPVCNKLHQAPEYRKYGLRGTSSHYDDTVSGSVAA